MKYKNKETGLFASFGGIPDSNWELASQNDIELHALKEAKDKKKKEINKQRDERINAPYSLTIGNKIYLLSRSIRSELAWIKFAGKEIDVPWITDDNEIIYINKNVFKSISVHLGDRDTNEAIQARKRKDAVNALTTISEIENYDITTIYEL